MNIEWIGAEAKPQPSRQYPIIHSDDIFTHRLCSCTVVCRQHQLSATITAQKDMTICFNVRENERRADEIGYCVSDEHNTNQCDSHLQLQPAQSRNRPDLGLTLALIHNQGDNHREIIA
ncbi:MAG: hypothetical protein J07HQW2_01044 [Haloquadratum walsbyi J07HQW2]|uniref:Uncharacterized protein n=1 Tax=Haloquadratum walsbyi J07HQW2 TaxID=1238425 RepID=U1ND27_9EURY|nr:MAG: hypothetical protein J07HQW2_01044 [Haloquadratum walsbyi J07HQW2]